MLQDTKPVSLYLVSYTDRDGVSRHTTRADKLVIESLPQDGNPGRSLYFKEGSEIGAELLYRDPSYVVQSTNGCPTKNLPVICLKYENEQVISGTLRRDGTSFQAQFDITRAVKQTKQEADKDADAIAEILDHSTVQLDAPEQLPSPEESDEAVSEIISTPVDILEQGYQKFKKFKALLMKKKSQSSLEEIGEEASALETEDSSRPTVVESAPMSPNVLLRQNSAVILIPAVAPDAPKGKKSKGRKKKSLLPKKKKKGTKPKRNTGLKKKGKSTRVSKKRKGSKVLNMA